jgi:Fe2+ or Zn2+ uptake regulation protein
MNSLLRDENVEPAARKKNTDKKIQEQATELLAREELKRTELRVDLLVEFIKTRAALSQAELLTKIEKKRGHVDRVSVYRNLSTLTKSGLIHELAENCYVFCSHRCATHAHVLLVCESCHRHLEIADHHLIQALAKPLAFLGFFQGKTPLAIRGFCLKCQSSQTTPALR